MFWAGGRPWKSTCSRGLSRRRLRRLLLNVITGTIASSRRSRVKQAVQLILPPVVAHPLRRGWFKTGILASVSPKPWRPPVFYDGLEAAHAKTERGQGASEPAPRFGRPIHMKAPISHDSQVETHLKNALSRCHGDREVELWPLFLHDLDRLICLAGDLGDHIFLPTAHGRDAYAIRRLIKELGESEK